MKAYHPIVLLTVLITVGTQCAVAQTPKEETHDHNETTEHWHAHHRHEIGIANAPVYYIKEKEISYGLHLHYVYNIKATAWGIGLGYERVFDEHGHNTMSLVGSYRPTPNLNFIAAPGITYESTDRETHFAVHLETSYEFQVDHFHIGPVAEVAYDPEDIHISFGLHIGIGF